MNDCFLSIVSKDCARDELLVRARRKGDVEKIFPGATVVRSQRTDYLFRAVVKRAEVESAIVGELRRITYGNFKESVPEEDRALHDAYLRVWSTMAGLQPTRPYGGFNQKKIPGRAAGGHARMVKLSPEERSANARMAANVRWGKLAPRGD